MDDPLFAPIRAEELLLAGKSDFVRSSFRKLDWKDPPFPALAEPVSILNLRPGMCATVVDGDFSLPHYCGLPVTYTPLRFCAHHAKRFLTRPQ